MMQTRSRVNPQREVVYNTGLCSTAVKYVSDACSQSSQIKARTLEYCFWKRRQREAGVDTDRNSHRDVNELDEVANEAHDSKAHSDSLADLDEFYHTDWHPNAERRLASRRTFL